MRRGRSSAWVVDGAEMSDSLGMEEVRLINDFVANGYGLLTLDEATETVTIQVPSLRPIYRPFPVVPSPKWMIRVCDLRASSRGNTEDAQVLFGIVGCKEGVWLCNPL